MADHLVQHKHESDIIARVKQGGRADFEQLVVAYKDQLFVFIINLTGSREQSEDILQEVFLSAYKQIHTFNSRRGSFSTWLYTIARNKCFNVLKKKQAILLEDFPDPVAGGTPDEDLLKKEAFYRLDRALKQLPLQDQSIFNLFEIQGLSYKEISRIESIRIGTVKSRLARAREKLKAILKSYMG